MTIQLVPLTEDDFTWYRENLAVAYAQEQVANGKWDQATALQQAKDNIAHSLPEGLATKDNFLYLVMTEGNPDAVGQLWVNIRPGIEPSGFIMDIEIYTPYQRQGYAQQTLLALEALLKPMGIAKIELHVHALNHGAKALYEKMGFSITGYAILKRIESNE